MRNNFLILSLLTCVVFMSQAIASNADENNVFSLASNNSPDITIKERQVIEMSNSLKNIIEQNQQLLEQKQQLEHEVDQLKNEKLTSQGKYIDLEKKKNHLTRNVEKIKNVNRKYTRKIKKLERRVDDLQVAKAQHTRTAKRLERELVQYDDSDVDEPDNVIVASNRGSRIAQSRSSVAVINNEEKTLDVLTSIDAFTEEDELLRMDSAKAHYNMGNIYFQKGEFEIAAREYYQAVTLMPDDPDAHYNLAFVSGEYLNDFETALKHYQMYLYLNPKAQDLHIVKGKILTANLELRSLIDSPLEKKQQQ